MSGEGQEIRHVRWPLIDFLVASDSAAGMHLLAAASMLTEQGADSHLNEMGFDPVLVRQWVALVLPHLDSTDRAPKPAHVEVVGLPLPTLDATGAVTVGYDPAEPSGQRFFLFWGDSATHTRWRALATVKNIRDLLDAIDAMAAISRVRSDTAAHRDSWALRPIVQERPMLLTHPNLVYPPEAQRYGIEGRVWLEVVIDTLGVPEMATVRVLFSDDSSFSRAALMNLAGSRFRPGRAGGAAVRLWIRIPFEFCLDRKCTGH